MTQNRVEKFPWRRLFRLAMAQGLDPHQIWNMTAGELHLSLVEADAAHAPKAPVSPQIFEALKQQCEGAEGKPNNVQ